jgi:TRAP-type C4-dicarboxylate transport system permease small subunit
MRKVLERIEAILVSIATLALLVTMFAISIDAFGRYLLDRPLAGVYEFTSLYPMAIIVFATLSANYASSSHVSIGSSSHPLRRRLGRWHDRAIALICLPVFGYFAWSASVEAISKVLMLEAGVGPTPFPVYLSYLWVAIGALCLCARFVSDIVMPGGPDGGRSAEPAPE